MVAKGFRFGMLLQLAIGPVCLFIFQTSVGAGFLAAEAGVLGTALTDGSEILLAILGVGLVLNRSKNAKNALRIFGAAILFIFGANSMLGAFGITLLPSLALGGAGAAGTFFQAVLLALSNPLTILFWAGVFSAKIVEENMQGSDLNFFGLGCVLSTLFFLTLVAVVGSLTHAILPRAVIQVLNFAVGALMVYFGVRNLRAGKKDEAAQETQEA